MMSVLTPIPILPAIYSAVVLPSTNNVPIVGIHVDGAIDIQHGSASLDGQHVGSMGVSMEQRAGLSHAAVCAWSVQWGGGVVLVLHGVGRVVLKWNII